MVPAHTPSSRLKGFANICRHLGFVSGQRRTEMFATLTKLLKNEDGATAIEYGLIAALIAVAAIGAFTA